MEFYKHNWLLRDHFPSFEMPGRKFSVFMTLVGIITSTVCLGFHFYAPLATGSGWFSQAVNEIGRVDEFARLLTGLFCGVFPLVLGLCFALFHRLGITMDDEV